MVIVPEVAVIESRVSLSISQPLPPATTNALRSTFAIAKVVGIALGTATWDQIRRFAASLADVIRTLDEPPLLVISSDMNHYASDAENRRLDEMALAAMETLDPVKLHETVTQRNISMCGMLPAVIVMQTLRNLGQLRRSERVAYATSGDVSGDKSRVVGYAGMLLAYAAARW